MMQNAYINQGVFRRKPCGGFLKFEHKDYIIYSHLSHLALVPHEASGLRFDPLLSANNFFWSRLRAKVRSLPDLCGEGAFHDVSGS